MAPLDKSQEARTRRAAERHGLRLERCRHRDPAAPGFGRYRLSDPRTGTVVAGIGERGEFTMTLDDVADYLASGGRRAALDTKRPG